MANAGSDADLSAYNFYTSSVAFRKEVMESGKFFEVIDTLTKQGLLNPANVKKEVEWFFFKLGIDEYYFSDFSSEMIASHITQLHAARILSEAHFASEFSPSSAVETAPQIEVIQENPNHALYFCNSIPGAKFSKTHGVEARIDQRYLNKQGQFFRYHSYRSRAPVFENRSDIFLRLQFVQKAEFKPEGPKDSLKNVAGQLFLSRVSEQRAEICTRLLEEVKDSFAPSYHLSYSEEDETCKVIVAYKQDFSNYYFSSLSSLYHYYGLTTQRKYVDQFSNGVTMISFVFRRSSGATDHLPEDWDFKRRVEAFTSELHYLYVIPTSEFHSLHKSFALGIAEVAYLNAAGRFCYYFLRQFHEDWRSLAEVMDATNPMHNAIVNRLRGRLGQHAATERNISETLSNYPKLVKLLFQHFRALHCPCAPHILPGDPAEEKMRDIPTPKEIEALNAEITDRAKLMTTPFEAGEDSEFDLQVFQCLIHFNISILKTNFFDPSKVAFAFRMDSRSIKGLSFVNKTPYGYFFFIGGEFRGFHLRFQDVARGGIRIVRSSNREAYNRNKTSLLEENYNLAHTQQRKNKDIPEGGSKGTILLTFHKDAPMKAKEAFQKYVDAMLDVLLPQSRRVLDYYGKEEILFLGPDEGTASYMEWACLHARERGYRFWRSFTTGKPLELGGIPHDMFGMTTRSVHQYVLGALSHLSLKEQECTKFQTGGPDGDLGSNEIKISSDKTVSIVDGSGVLVDPEGINREELVRLATTRQMVTNFDRTKLSKQGFIILIEDKHVLLPNGEVIESGLAFRNAFHLLPSSSATLFVPCGGRPNAVTIHNAEKLLDESGEPRFRIIVEGANLFFTQAARLKLEKAGVLLFKDASANKGGVTSSSLEVLAGLSFSSDDELFRKNMVVCGDVVPPFYSQYVEFVQKKIEENAHLECQLILKEHEMTKTPQCVLSDQLSEKINDMKLQIFQSDLFSNVDLRDRILKKALPPLLVDLIGYEKVLQNVPSAYLQSIFATFIASHFVYERGLSTTTEFTFYEFMVSLK